MMRTQAILKFSPWPFFQRVEKVVMMRAQAPQSFPLAVFSAALEIRHDAHASCSGILPHRFFQRTRKLVMMRTRAVLNLAVFSAASESRHDARAKTQNDVAYPTDTCYAFANGAEAQNRWPQKRRIGDGDGKVD